MTNRIWLTAFVSCIGASASLFAVEADHLHWKLNLNVKDTVLKEIGEYEKNLKATLGRDVLSHTPYVVDKNKYPEAKYPAGPRLEAMTVEQLIDGHLKLMRKWADHDNQDYLPAFNGYRRAQASTGYDILHTPVMLTAPRFGQLTGNITLKLEWEQVGGRFKNNWDKNEVDEVYEVELNATLTLGIAMSMKNDRKLTVINHSVTKPIVTGWHTSLVASEGEVQKAHRVKPSDKETGK
jgi:hypothetical protein